MNHRQQSQPRSKGSQTLFALRKRHFWPPWPCHETQVCLHTNLEFKPLQKTCFGLGASEDRYHVKMFLPMHDGCVTQTSS